MSSAGTFRPHNGQQFLRQALNDERVGLEEIDGIWNVLYYQTLLGRFDERMQPQTAASRRLYRRSLQHNAPEAAIAMSAMSPIMP